MLTSENIGTEKELRGSTLEDTKVVFDENINCNDEIIIKEENPIIEIDENKKEDEDLERETQNNESIILCLLCEFTPNSNEVMLDHLKNDHGLTIDVSSLSTNKEENQVKQCQLCFYKGTDLNSHMEIAHLKFHCPLCEYTADHRCSLKKHVDRVHLNKVAKNLIGDLHGVRQKAKPKIDKFCDFCDYKTCDNSKLTTHIKSNHLNIKDYKCEHCDYSCASKHNMQHHVNHVHLKIRREKKFVCEYCGYGTWVKARLQEHVDTIHLNVMKFKCDQCDYGTNLKQALRDHVNTLHLKIKKEKCQYCDYATVRKENLKFHIDGVHLKKRDQKCHLCDYTTYKKYNLNNHIKIVHMNVKKIKCEMCKFSTFFESKLDVHKKRVHDVQSEPKDS